jgi:hypothetical protein
LDTLPENGYKTIYMQYGNAAALSISAIPGTFFGPYSSTDSVDNGSAGGVTDSQRGFRFYPNEDILVTDFGKRDPNGTTRYITLFDFATQAILMQTQVAGPAAQYSYSPISAPIWLTQGTEYILEMHQGSSDGYYFGSSTQIGQHLTYLDMRYCNGCDQNTFPTNYLNAIHYGYPDLWYWSKTNVTPAPSYSFNSYAVNLADSSYLCINDTLLVDPMVGGGMAPFTYEWTNHAINDTTLESPAIFTTIPYWYHVSIQDVCGYQHNDSIYIHVQNLPVSSIQANPNAVCEGESTVLSGTGTYTFVWNDLSTNDTLIATPNTTSTFSFTATDSLGCFNTQSVVVSVYYANAVSNPVTLCYGESYTIGNNTYTQNGTYVDTLQTVHGCDSVVTSNISVLPDIDAQIQQAGMYLVADAGATSYQWIDCTTDAPIAGATGATFAMQSNGNYACLVTVNGCTKKSNCIAFNSLSLAENTAENGFQVYPNPANASVHLFSKKTGLAIITDLMGKVIWMQVLQAETVNTVPLEQFASGTYFVHHGNSVSKLLVTKQ